MQSINIGYMQSPMNKRDSIGYIDKKKFRPTPPPLSEQGNRKGDQDHIAKNAVVMAKLTKRIFSLFSTVSVLIMYPLSPPIKTAASEDTRCAVDSLMMDQRLQRSNRSIQEARLMVAMMSVR